MTARREEIPELEGLKSWRMWLTATAIMTALVALPAVIEAWF